MITDYQTYCGSALGRLIDNIGIPLTVRRAFTDRNGYYILNEKLPMLIKYSRSRKGPWIFNYQKEHQLFYNELVRAFGECLTAYVCGKDGVPAVNQMQKRQFLDEVFDDQETVSIRRRLRKMYSIKGRDGELDGKVSRDSLVTLTREHLCQ